MTAVLPVVEVFHSIQGEGIRVGEQSTFIRLAGCNLRCSWCDTPWSWSAEGVAGAERVELAALAERVRERAVVITGGEPMLHERRLPDLCGLLRERGVTTITVETNATRFSAELGPLVDLWSLSPKLPASGEVADVVTIGRFLEAAPGRVQLKFVIADGGPDWTAMWQLLDEVQASTAVPVIVQPDGLRDDYSDALRELAELVAADGGEYHGAPRRSLVRVLPQVHRVAWGAHARGV